MSATLTTTPAAGWYPDPSDSGGAWRWWDGGSWTDQVRPKAETAPVAVVAPVAPFVQAVPPAPEPSFTAPLYTAPVPQTMPAAPSGPAFPSVPVPDSIQSGPIPQQAPASHPTAIPQPGQPVNPAHPTNPVSLTPETPASEQEYWHSPNAEVVHIPGRTSTSHTAASRMGGPVSRKPLHFWGDVGSPQTVGIWLLASLPLLSIALQIAVGVVLGVLQAATGVVVPLPNLVFTVIVLIAAWIFAGNDIKTLRARGYEPPSIAWMLLLPPLAYFIVRGKIVRREGKRAWPPELLYFLSVIGILGITAAYVVLIVTMMGGIDGLIAMATAAA